MHGGDEARPDGQNLPRLRQPGSRVSPEGAGVLDWGQLGASTPRHGGHRAGHRGYTNGSLVQRAQEILRELLVVRVVRASCHDNIVEGRPA